MAEIPTTTATMPSRINEADADLNMTGTPSSTERTGARGSAGKEQQQLGQELCQS
jgi:hypothetical protein